MRRHTAVAIALGVLLAACSARTPTGGGTTVSPSLSATATGTQRARPVPVARQVVFAAEDALWLYDVRRNAVSQLAKGEDVRHPRWVSKTQVSFIQGARGSRNLLRLVDIPGKSYKDVFEIQTGIEAYGWSPDRETVADVTVDRFGYPHLEYRSVGTGVVQSVATLARALGRDGTIDDQARVEFSRDGRFVLVVFTPADGDGRRPVPETQSQLQVRSIEGDLAFGVDHALDPTMAVWSVDGRTVYFRTASGLRAWKAGATRSVGVRGGVGWFDPAPSPAGRSVAFDTGAASVKVRVRTLDLRTGARADVTKDGFFHPIVPDARTVWVQRVKKCVSGCLDPVVAAPEVFAVDLKTRKQRKLALSTLLDADVRYE